jgi:hypothetical protein
MTWADCQRASTTSPRGLCCQAGQQGLAGPFDEPLHRAKPRQVLGRRSGGGRAERLVRRHSRRLLSQGAYWRIRPLCGPWRWVLLACISRAEDGRLPPRRMSPGRGLKGPASSCISLRGQPTVLDLAHVQAREQARPNDRPWPTRVSQVDRRALPRTALLSFERVVRVQFCREASESRRAKVIEINDAFDEAP